jgi:hypothetical protein
MPDQRRTRLTDPRKSLFGDRGSVRGSIGSSGGRMKKIPVLVKREVSGTEDFEREQSDRSEVLSPRSSKWKIINAGGFRIPKILGGDSQGKLLNRRLSEEASGRKGSSVSFSVKKQSLREVSGMGP